ncbi:SpoIIE family protein phosphatase [Catellatospora chokoriensis]|uniref:Transcription antitermination regulator n=1 Tax=Catellatospora chokoriensis TaxID=310353 RepID=A0A8J3K6L8_9ACTN|nr:SpoIIE family protein phosphatase [Catellatospora chokoriensis]GIF91650.1 transcription antitermination regulator [Catellatospora chokoriensis]
MARQAAPPPAEADWVARVQRLEAELAGLRKAMRTRGLIEQAKGLLAERFGSDPESAFARLSAMSQQRNVSVVDLAADLVGATVPDTAEAQDPPTAAAAPLDLPGRATPGLRTIVGLDDDPARTLPQARARVLRKCLAALDAAPDFPTLADVLVTVGLGDAPGAVAAVFSAEVDGAVRLVASHGWPAQVASEWQRSPSSLPTTIGAVVRTGRPLLLDGLQPHDFVLIGPGPARAVYPLAVDDHMVGALSLVWGEPREFTATDRAFLDRLAAGAGRAVRRLWSTADTTPAALPVWLATALDVLGGRGHLLTPVRGDDGSVEDFVIAAAGPAVRASDGDTVGRLLLDVYPRLRVNGVFDAYVELLSGDVPFAREGVVEDAVVDGRPRRVILNRRAARVGDALLASWERIDAAVSSDARMARLETLSRSGWAEWDLQAGDAVWSPGLYGLVGRDQAHGPTTLDKFGSFFATADRGLLRELLTGLAQGRPDLALLRLNTAHGVVPVRVFAEADLAGDDIRLIRLVLHDVSEQHAAEDRWTRSETVAAARQIQLAAEQSLTANLTRLLYPGRDLVLHTPGAAVTGRHYAATAPRTQLRGDFCDAERLDDGSLLFVIGDAFGTGLVAAAAVVRLRFPVVTLGAAGTAPAEILRIVNGMLMGAPDGPLASLLIGHYQPADRTLRWASAGHLQPLLVRDGVATVVDDPAGPLLGLLDGQRFDTHTLRLQPGDSFVSFTDGVLHKRKRDPLAEFATRVAAAYRKDGTAGLWELTPPERDDEACLLALEITAG